MVKYQLNDVTWEIFSLLVSDSLQNRNRGWCLGVNRDGLEPVWQREKGVATILDKIKGNSKPPSPANQG